MNPAQYGSMVQQPPQQQPYNNMNPGQAQGPPPNSYNGIDPSGGYASGKVQNGPPLLNRPGQPPPGNIGMGSHFRGSPNDQLNQQMGGMSLSHQQQTPPQHYGSQSQPAKGPPGPYGPMGSSTERPQVGPPAGVPMARPGIQGHPRPVVPSQSVAPPLSQQQQPGMMPSSFPQQGMGPPQPQMGHPGMPMMGPPQMQGMGGPPAPPQPAGVGPPMPPHPGLGPPSQPGHPQQRMPLQQLSGYQNPSSMGGPPNSIRPGFPPGPTATPPLSSVNIGGSPTPPAYPQSAPAQGAVPHANGPLNTYGQYPQHSGMTMRYPADATNYSQPNHQGQPGVQQLPPGSYQNRMPQPQQQPMQQQQQQAAGRRLDPDQMPSPIQVIEDDRKNKGGDFYTNTRGQVPPLVTTTFKVHDEGISSPRFMRSTIYSIPCSPDMLKQMAVPFAVSVCPFAKLQPGEAPPPISDLKELGPVRCNRCKAYMCAFMQFIDGGRRFQCVFCKATTEVPLEYFAHLDHQGHRVDKFQRPELCLGSFEYIATKEYCRHGEFPKTPAFIFMIDVSFPNIKSGMVSLLCQNLKRILKNLPCDVGQETSSIRVGFVTYSSVIHFYNVKGTLAAPQMMVVPDVKEMFVPLVDGFLVTLDESEAVIDSLLEQIPLMFAETRETEIVLGPVIQAGLEALKAADCSGKLFIFHSSLPIAEAPGKLKNRDDRKLLATDKEKTILTPQNTFYNTLGQECVAASCCVDLFLFPNQYLDIATVSQISKLTGGHIYKYTYFQADVDGSRFLEDLWRDVEKPIAFEAVMRVRTSTGIRPTDFFGNYYSSNTTDVELAAVDCDKALMVEIKYDDKLTEEEGAFVQTAVLYTSCSGQRRLRIHNLALNTCSQMADLYRNCELDTVVNFLAKQALRNLMDQTPRQVKDGLISRAAQILATYRKNCASPSSVGQLILPECMKLLPLYTNCLLKNDAISGGSDMTVDDRSFAMSCLNSMDIPSSVGYFYPRMLPLHELDPTGTDLPVALRCTLEKLRENGAYLLENGFYMFFWLGQQLSSEWLNEVFAVQSTSHINPEKGLSLELDTPMCTRVRGIVDAIKDQRNRSIKTVVVRQGDKLEVVFRQFLVEDRTGESSVSYVDFLCHLHKEIRNLLT